MLEKSLAARIKLSNIFGYNDRNNSIIQSLVLPFASSVYTYSDTEINTFGFQVLLLTYLAIITYIRGHSSTSPVF